MIKLLVLVLTIFLQSCSTNFLEFFSHKKEMEVNYGPCEWVYVGIDTEILNPAIRLKPPVGKDYVLWNQICKSI